MGGPEEARVRGRLWGIELDTLRFFCCVYDLTGGEYRTAKVVLDALAKYGYGYLKDHTSVTNKVKKLEGAIGAGRLFHRDRARGFTGRTAIADAIEPDIRRLINRLSELSGTPVSDAEGTVTVAASPTILEYILPAVIKPYLAHWQSRRRIRLEELTDATAASIERGATQVAIGWQGGDPAPTPALREWILAPDRGFRWVVAVPADHPFNGRQLAANREEVGPPDLRGETVLYPDHRPLRDAITRWPKGEAHFVEVTTTSVVLAQVRLGVLGIVPDLPWVLEACKKRSELVWYPMDVTAGVPPAVIRVTARHAGGADVEDVHGGNGPVADLVRRLERHLRELPRAGEWDDLFDAVPITPESFAPNGRWRVHYVSCSSRATRGPEWFAGHLDLDRGATRPIGGGQARGHRGLPRRPGLRRGCDTETTLAGLFVDYPEAGSDRPAGRYSVSGRLVSRMPAAGRPSGSFFLELRGDPTAWTGQPRRHSGGRPAVKDVDDSGGPFVAAFCAAVRLRRGTRRPVAPAGPMCLVGNWTSQDGLGRPTSGVMLLAPTHEEPLSELEQRLLADHSLLRYLPNALAHAAVLPVVNE